MVHRLRNATVSTAASILKQANAAISAGDHEGFLAFCTDDTTWVFVGDRTLSGKDEVRRWMQETYRLPPVFDVHRSITDGDEVVAMGNITVVDQNGKSVRSAYCDVWRLREGKLAELQAFVVEGARLGKG